ncbi:hypothetical protein [Nostoc sp. 'Peltigera membranacea cyanobiont' 232]|uniref:hypothetical protein n=1 Tax=Nostoc sp. 'Peltigera membranacea cyanobiont' 232 TaxID=2014531 RepID=UPI000B953B0C|nr:hypothetical protein [Nostoc sp. 'Peltigera membranacea cyanobiont' 232]OYE04741.1 hypothetical protein CDG79_11425 [Nostoc sp. 'Peltigera membranacea cyanobiont' 232]
MISKPLPQKVKTQLAQLAVFPDQLSKAQLACELRCLASEIEFDSPVPQSKLFSKIQKFYADFYEGKFDSAFATAAALEEIASSAWKEFDESYQSAIKIP